jgi:hypothetical protein
MTESDRRAFVELLNECGCAAAERALSKFAAVRVSEHTDSKAAALALMAWIEGYAERAVVAHVAGVKTVEGRCDAA